MRKKPIELDHRRSPWERQPGEPARQYARLAVYLELGPARTMAQAAEILSATGDPVSHAATRSTASTYRWVERAAAHDQEQRRLHAERMHQQRREMTDRYARLGRRLTDLVEQALRLVQPVDLRPTELARLAEVACKIEHTALSEPVQPITYAPGSLITGDELVDGRVQEFAGLPPEKRLARMRELAASLERRIRAAHGLYDDTED
jgi:hypothetical protein